VKTITDEFEEMKEKYNMPSVKNLVDEKLKELKEALTF
jgi:hypothetical protein